MASAFLLRFSFRVAKILLFNYAVRLVGKATQLQQKT